VHLNDADLLDLLDYYAINCFFEKYLRVLIKLVKYFIDNSANLALKPNLNEEFTTPAVL